MKYAIHGQISGPMGTVADGSEVFFGHRNEELSFPSFQGVYDVCL